MDYYSDFCLECEQQFEQAEAALVSLGNVDAPERLAYWTIFLRVVHNIKGSSSMVGNEKLEVHCHRIEDLCSTINEICEIANLDALLAYLFSFIDSARVITFEPQSELDFEYVFGIDEFEKLDSVGKKSSKSLDIEIIVVDDEQIFLNLLEDIVKEVSSSFKLFSDPVKACEYIKSRINCVVVSDINMPKLNGFQLFDEVNKEKDIPFVFVTASEDNRGLMELVDKGAFGVIKKPYKREELLYCLTQLYRYAQKKLVATRSLKHLVCHFDSLAQLYKDQNREFLITELKDDIDFLISHS